MAGISKSAPATGERRHSLISPSIMCADQLRLGEEIDDLERLGVDWLHMDIMDGHYVPNLTYGPGMCRNVAAASSLPLDIHLMVDEPDRWGPIFAEVGTNPIVSIHPETTWHPARTLAAIRDAGARPGIAIDPGQKPAQFENLLDLVDLVLVMCVNPGYSGQKLLPWTVDSIAELVALRKRRANEAGSGSSFLIQVDGNVSWANIPAMRGAGADVLVAGTSSLFDPALSRSDAMARLKKAIGRD